MATIADVEITVRMLTWGDAQAAEDKLNLAEEYDLKGVAFFKFDGEQIIEEYTSLVNPECPIPYFITGLTGIDESLLTPIPWSDEDKNYDSESVKKYNIVLKEISDELRDIFFLGKIYFILNDLEKSLFFFNN